MVAKTGDDMPQITMRNDETALIRLSEAMPDGVGWWAEQYFQFEVTTSPASQKVQQRDLKRFLRYLIAEEHTDQREAWTPRLSRDFQRHLRQTLNVQGQRVWSDKTIIRVMAHLKTFAKWVHKLRPFPLGNPMAKITLPGVGTGLEVERALTPGERRKMLEYRNRAIVYALHETGMRRAAITKLNLEGMDVRRKTLTVEEKGGSMHTYQISHEGLQAIRDYVAHERESDAEYWQSVALFLPTSTTHHSHGRLAALAVNDIWNTVCRVAGVHGRTPHSARHAMGKYLVEKTGNIAAVQKQLGHKQAVYSMQYARITAEELGRVLDGR